MTHHYQHLLPTRTVFLLGQYEKSDHALALKFLQLEEIYYTPHLSRNAVYWSPLYFSEIIEMC